MDKTTMANEKLHDKLNKEYELFIDNLKTLSPEKIIKSAYEIVAKEDILSIFEFGNALDFKQARALNSMKKPLDYLYYEWLDTDFSNTDTVKDYIYDFADKAVTEMQERSENDRLNR